MWSQKVKGIQPSWRESLCSPVTRGQSLAYSQSAERTCWMKWYAGGILRCRMVLEEGQGCSEVWPFTLHPLGICWPSIPISRVGHSSCRTEGSNLSQYEPCLQKKIQSFHLPRDTLKLAGGQSPGCQGSPSSPGVTRGPMCTQSPSLAPGAPTSWAQLSSKGNELQTPSCAGRWKAWRRNVLRFTKTSGLSHLLNQPQENTPRLSFLVEGTKISREEGRGMHLKKKKK